MPWFEELRYVHGDFHARDAEWAKSSHYELAIAWEAVKLMHSLVVPPRSPTLKT